MLHEEVDAVFFERDGVGVGLGDALDDLEVEHVELKSSRRALVGSDLAGDDDAGFLSEAFQGFEDGGRDALDVGYALDGAGTVAKDWKEQLAAFAQVVEPSAQDDGLAGVLGDGGDSGHWRRLRCGSHLRWGRRRLRANSGFRGGGYGFFGHELPWWPE